MPKLLLPLAGTQAAFGQAEGNQTSPSTNPTQDPDCYCCIYATQTHEK